MTRRFVVELDLCGVHDKDALSGKAIVIPKGFLKLMKKEREAKKAKREPRAKVDYEMTAARVLKFAQTHKSFNAAIVTDMLKLSSASVGHKVCALLVKQGRLKSTGKGPSRKLELVTEKPRTNGAKAA